MPDTLTMQQVADLAGVSGIGRAKLERFGPSVMRVLGGEDPQAVADEVFGAVGSQCRADGLVQFQAFFQHRHVRRQPAVFTPRRERHRPREG